MSLSVKVVLNKVHQKQDNTYPLTIRVTYNRRLIYIPLGYSFSEKDFDEKNQRIKKGCKTVDNITRLNNKIITEVKNVFDTISKLEEEKKIDSMSMKDIKNEITRKHGNSDQTLFAYYHHIIQELKNSGKFGNANIYNDSLKAWKKYLDGKDITFHKINYKTLKAFESFFLSRGVKPNTISVYLRTFRAVYNRGIKEGVCKRENYPFDNYKIPSNKTSKRAISLDVIKQIEDYRPEPQTALYDAKQFFLFSFYCRGINFVDIAYLTNDNISGDRLNYTRRKTGTNFSIKLIPKAQAILEQYRHSNKLGYLFPIIKSDSNDERIFLQVKNKLQNYNKLLKKISKDLDLDVTLSTYTARHSYATGLKSKGISSEVIKESMGHTSVAVTETYLKSFENSIIDSADELLFE